MKYRRSLSSFFKIVLISVIINSLVGISSVKANLDNQDGKISWTDVQKFDNTIYFLFRSIPSTIKSYDLETETWMPEITINHDVSLFRVDNTGFFFSETNSLYFVDLEGQNEIHLNDVPAEDGQVVSLHVFNDFLIVQSRPVNYGSFSSFNKKTGEIIDRFRLTYSLIKDSKVSQTYSILIGRESLTSPAALIEIHLNIDGSFGEWEKIHTHSSTKQLFWLTKNDSLLLDNNGSIYSFPDIKYVSSLGRRADDAVFINDLPVILRDGTLFAYGENYLETGQFRPDTIPNKIFSNGEKIYSFYEESIGINPRIEIILPEQFSPVIPSLTIDPTSITFVPDIIELGDDGILYLLHKTSKNIFRWDVLTHQYLSSIPLIGYPQYFEYSVYDHSLYVTYESGQYSPGSVTKIFLSEPFKEEFFLNLPTPICQPPVSVHEFILIGYDTMCSWIDLSTYKFDGALQSTKPNSYGSIENIWNDITGRFYLATDNVSPASLVHMSMDSYGILGDTFSSQRFDRVSHPIRVSEDGSLVITGQGWVFDGDLFNQIGTLANSIIDGFWTEDNEFITIHAVTGGSQLQKWNSNYELTEESPILIGEPLRIFDLTHEILVVTKHNQTTRLSILDREFNLLNTPPVINYIHISGPERGDAPLRTSFLANVTPTIVGGYLWDFGDGETSIESSPSHLFMHSGSYSVKLTVFNQDGQDVKYYHSRIIVNPTVANFSGTPREGPAPITVQFANLTNGSVFDSILWDFGDGSLSTSLNPTHIYQKPGVYSISLTMNGPGGESTLVRPNYITVLWETYLPIVSNELEIFTLPGTYVFNRCDSFPIYEGDGNIGITMNECVESVTAQPDGNLRFNFTWKAHREIAYSGGCLTRYSDENNHNMYIVSNDNIRYDFIESGEVGYIECMEMEKIYSGWFLFPPAKTQGSTFIFHDLDNFLSFPNLEIPLK